MANNPDWISDFTTEVCQSFVPIDSLGPFGCHTCLHRGVWEVTIFVGRTEVVGGNRDGAVRYSRFSVDVETLRESFDRVIALGWQALPLGEGDRDELGAHLSVEGVYRGHDVWLRIPARAPERFSSARLAMVHCGEIRDVWQDEA